MGTPHRPIVHIGYHKTATKWFQKHLWPRLGSHDYVPREDVQQALLAPPGLHFDPAAARALLGLDRRERPVVLSEENLSGYIHNGGLHGLMGPEAARRIKAVLPDAQIVVFIRNQADAVRASYSQYVAAGGTFGLRRYLATNAGMKGALRCAFKAPAFEWEHFEYDRLIAHYDELFGRDRVHVYAFEELRDRPALLARMERDLGISFPADAAEAPATNRSQSRAAMGLLRFANLFTRQSVVNKSWIADLPGGHELRHVVNFLLKAVPGRPARLPRDIADQVRSRFAAANRRLRQMRELPIELLGYDVGYDPANVVELVPQPAAEPRAPRLARMRQVALYSAVGLALAGCTELVFDVI